ncbi:hypothetical protein COW36_08725 [bacterium (Candidatus Blackallbacteria) CG17_big_fil_post_rev_8_21_14_2_50_48_46]|uniref:Peptidase C11 n=1 Tax=bacterium (Candidatus Blackallbacteria) CG17_big_fil_post_rev_8_21_14_2_50_48_46 TaxID=2014261 RepID=A0A2M7G6J9_9BACT|nr:MAG: hypothetical protein COW64_06025 [bacterium (Candidatus Blackallbacteria) CG18_big_fil_WC_8_21_14_2_50_49_26]PIW17569.1 MAG: hypothetical protein COW36_08725 [bacterium (Candidatus Blackallbacteria) CG17_big_fil_post_rev_8_21_14_2_50_48_46]PIW48424.1 MAG: hypothetical protein COW20_10075 [bacterium (Candidatus Blackallbacteria) CG13_big_fil_rev_8_21_14_2_50_49_14]
MNLIQTISCSLISTLLITGCANSPLSATNLKPLPAVFQAQSQSISQAGAYQNFKLQPLLPVGKEPRRAVKLTYMMADDEGHQSPWSQQMLEMMDDLPQNQVYNLVFRDGNQMGDSRLYYLQAADNAPKTVRAPQSVLAPGVGEVQSNNPAVFSEVLKWSLDHYPAQYKYLQIYTHGAGLMGIGTDKVQTTPQGQLLPASQQQKTLSPPQLNQAMRQALRGRKLDLVYFRACLMGNLEALYELEGTVNYALASEDVSYSVENSNLTMTRSFDEMAGQGIAPREIARQLSIQALAKNGGKAMGYTTLAAFDLNQMRELKTAVNQLALTLIAKMPALGSQIRAAYLSVPGFKENNEGYYLRDFYAFGSALLEQVNDAQIEAAVLNARRAQEKVTLHARDSFGAKANGLSILMPPGQTLTDEKYRSYLGKNYQGLRFGRESAWDEFLMSLSDFMRATPMPQFDQD